MEFSLHIENLGNIKEAQVDVKPFTILAGENSSGKTFATKSLYCILDALNKDHLTNGLAADALLIKFIFEQLNYKIEKPINVDKKFLELIEDRFIPLIEEVIEHCDSLNLADQQNFAEDMFESLREIVNSVESYVEKRGNLKKFSHVKKDLELLVKKLNSFIFKMSNGRDTIIDGIEESLSDNLKKNFQTTTFNTLINNAATDDLSLSVDTIGRVSIDNRGDLDFSFTAQGIMEIQKLNNIVFVDSPVYLKIRKGLQSKSRFDFVKKDQENYLKGYPQYIENLYRYIDSEYIGEPDFIDLSNQMQDLIGGRLSVSKSGEVEFETEGGKIPLSFAAMGISNIGLIELLLRNNIINRGSFLIIDEPEAHLHPKWQTVLIDLLYKIARSGANVIIATHSIDMVKRVEILLKKDEEASEYVALNKMPFTKGFMKLKNEQKVSRILDDLSASFFDSYLEGL